MDILSRIQVLCQQLQELSVRTLGDVEDVSYVPAPYKQGNTPPEEGWLPYAPGTILRGFDAQFWLRAELTTPQAENFKEYFIL